MRAFVLVALALALVAVAPSCRLFGADLPCASDAHCAAGDHCALALGRCASGPADGGLADGGPGAPADGGPDDLDDAGVIVGPDGGPCGGPDAIVERFSTFDPDRWIVTRDGPASQPEIIGGGLLSLRTDIGGNLEVVARFPISLLGDAVVFDTAITPPTPPTGGISWSLRSRQFDDENEALRFRSEAGTLQAGERENPGSDNIVGAEPYDAFLHHVLRIRESDGEVFFDVRPDNTGDSGFVSFGSMPTPPYADRVFIAFDLEPIDESMELRVDGINLARAPGGAFCPLASLADEFDGPLSASFVTSIDDPSRCDASVSGGALELFAPAFVDGEDCFIESRHALSPAQSVVDVKLRSLDLGGGAPGAVVAPGAFFYVKLVRRESDEDDGTGAILNEQEIEVGAEDDTFFCSLRPESGANAVGAFDADVDAIRVSVVDGAVQCALGRAGVFTDAGAPQLVDFPLDAAFLRIGLQVFAAQDEDLSAVVESVGPP